VAGHGTRPTFMRNSPSEPDMCLGRVDDALGISQAQFEKDWFGARREFVARAARGEYVHGAPTGLR
jgi:hypothetical protein